MDGQEALELFLKNGLQLDKESLAYIAEKGFDGQFLSGLIESIQKEGKYVVGVEQVRLFESQRGTEKNPIIVLKKPEPLPESISLDDILEDKAATYDAVRGLLRQRWELVNTTSVNKITRNSTKFSLIAEVVGVERASKLMMLQDNTGAVSVSCAGIEDGQLAQIGVGDVLGFVCENGSPIKAEKIVAPDMPLFKERNKSVGKAVLVFISHIGDRKEVLGGVIKTIREKTGKAYERAYVFDLEQGSCRMVKPVSEPTPEDTTQPIYSPALLMIENAKVLLCGGGALPATDAPIASMTTLLRKRMIGYRRFGSVSLSPLVIDPAPDIFVTDLGGSQQANYKNTVLISLDDFGKDGIAWTVDLETYECLKVNLE